MKNRPDNITVYDGVDQENDSSQEITITKDQLGATLSMTKSETVKYIPVTNTFSKSYSIKKARYSIFNSSTSLNKGNNYIYLIPAFVGDDNNDETFFFKYEDGDFLLENLDKGQWNKKELRDKDDPDNSDNRMFLTFYNKKEEAFSVSSMELRKSIMGYGTSSSIITSDEEGKLLLMSIGDTNPISETQFNNMRWNFIKYGNDIGGPMQTFTGTANIDEFLGYRVSLYGKYLVYSRIGDNKWNTAGIEIYELKDDGLFGHNKSFTREVQYNGYGESVSIYDKYIFVGAIYEEGININRAGAVYIYKLNEEGDWGYYDKIEGEQENSLFGKSVSISDKYAFVGAVNEDDGKGAVYIYKLNEDGDWDWENYDKIEGSIPKGNFGYHVSVSGNNLIVCALDENGGENKGTVYIYELKNNKWTYVVEFKGEGNNNGDYFGNHASISDKYAIVGLCHENNSKGTVYLYERNEENGDWNLYKKIEGTHENMRFGSGVSFYNNYFMVTAQHDYITGSLYIYDIRDPMLSPVIRTHKSAIVGLYGDKRTYFGKSLCLTDKYAAVGAFNEWFDKGRLFVWKK